VAVADFDGDGVEDVFLARIFLRRSPSYRGLMRGEVCFCVEKAWGSSMPCLPNNQVCAFMASNGPRLRVISIMMGGLISRFRKMARHEAFRECDCEAAFDSSQCRARKPVWSGAALRLVFRDDEWGRFGNPRRVGYWSTDSAIQVMTRRSKHGGLGPVARAGNHDDAHGGGARDSKSIRRVSPQRSRLDRLRVMTSSQKIPAAHLEKIGSERGLKDRLMALKNRGGVRPSPGEQR